MYVRIQRTPTRPNNPSSQPRLTLRGLLKLLHLSLPPPATERERADGAAGRYRADPARLIVVAARVLDVAWEAQGGAERRAEPEPGVRGDEADIWVRGKEAVEDHAWGRGAGCGVRCVREGKVPVWVGGGGEDGESCASVLSVNEGSERVRSQFAAILIVTHMNST